MLFERNEYKERLTKVKAAMQKKGIDLLISHDPANMNYLTGYDAWSFYYAQCVLVHVNEDEPICFLRAQDAGGAYIKTYLKDKNIIKYDEKYIHTWPLHPYQYLVEIIKQRKWEKLNIGLEMDSHYFTAFCYETIKKGLLHRKLGQMDESLILFNQLVNNFPRSEYAKLARMEIKREEIYQ